MTVAEWLDTRTPTPPAELARQIRASLGSAAQADVACAADRCIDAAERAVAALLESGRTGRESAGDLLAADALVTYAFEAAADDPARLESRAAGAMVRLARLGAIRIGDAAAGLVAPDRARA